ncbi:Monooxygenase 3 [Glycine max]|nr:Monooxygenase 3 [Glycine max]
MVKVIIICVIDYIIRSLTHSNNGNRRDIVIVAAGIAGLTASFGLHRLGIRSLVLESSDTLRIARFALSKWENAWKALDAVGVGHILRQEHAQLMGCFWLNETKLVKLEFRVVTTSLITGQQTSAMRFKESGNQQTDREIRCVKRNLLLEVLANELPSGTIRYLSKVVAIEESGFYKILHLADGTAIKTKGDMQSGAVQSSRTITGLSPASCSSLAKVSELMLFLHTHQQDKELEENPAKLKQYGIMETEVVEDIVIVGAGIAGLTTSLGLHKLGIRSLVLESSDTLRVTGFALSIWENAWKALDTVGVGDFLRHQHLQLNGRNREIRCVKRKLLLEALANELPKSGFSKIKIVRLDDGTTIKTKVLIGCDGINSVVAKWLGFKEASFTGRYVIRGYKKLMNNHGLEPKFMHYFGKGFRSGVMPCDDNTVYWFLTWTPTSEEKELAKNPSKMKQLVLRKVEKMPSDIKTFIEKTETKDILTSPLKYRHEWELMLGKISKGNVCVVGDAFHPMAPDLGQGGCCALEDGIILARHLAEAFTKKTGKHVAKEMGEEGKSKEQYKKIEASLRKYAKERRWRNIDISVTSYVLGFVLQGDLKLVSHFRDKLFPAFLAELLLKKSDFDCGKLN